MLGAAALLLWGLRLIKTGVLRSFGTTLRHWIGRGTKNRVMAAGSGIVATLAVQSSTATAVIASSFAARTLISDTMAQAVILGANVGTALVAVVLSHDIGWLSPALVFVGVAVFSLSDKAKGKGIGRAILGLGLMLLALSLMGEATLPVRESELVREVFLGLSQAPILAMLFAAGLATMASSSLAVVLFVVVLSQSGTVTPTLALALVAGANLGGAIPPCLAVRGEGIEARRIAATNLGVRVAGALALTLCAPWLAGPVSALVPGVGALALATHVGLNITLLVVFLPLLGPLVRQVARRMPAPKEPVFGPIYLDNSAMNAPGVALAAAARETLRLGDMVRDMLEGSRDAINETAAPQLGPLTQTENRIDHLQGAIKIYLARLGRQDLDDADIQRSSEIMAYAVNLEHIGDIIDSGLADLAAKKAKRRLRFSNEGLEEITEFYDRTLEVLRLSQSVFMSRDPDLARQLVDAKVEVRHLEAQSSEKHLERLRAQRTESIETSGLHLDILRDLKRINAHLVSVAHPILDELGALRESRLQSVPPARASEEAPSPR